MKVYLDTIGCRLNQSEIESMARQFRAAGHEIVPVMQEADMAVVNTCAVTAEAASDSRGKIRQIARAGVEEIIATGCWVTLQPDEAKNLPNIQRVVPSAERTAKRVPPRLVYSGSKRAASRRYRGTSDGRSARKASRVAARPTRTSLSGRSARRSG